MAVRNWEPKAQPIADIKSLKLSGTITEDSDITITINEKAISIQSPGDTADDFCEEIASVLSDLSSTIPELAEIEFEYVASDAEKYNPYVLMTGKTLGQPFSISAAGGKPPIDVDSITRGGPGKNAKYAFYFSGTGTAGYFIIKWELNSTVQFSLPIPYASHTAAAVKSAIVLGMDDVADRDIKVSGLGTEGSKYIIEATADGDFAETPLATPEVITTGITGGGAYHFDEVRKGTASPAQRGGSLVFEGYNNSSQQYIVITYDIASGSQIGYATVTQPTLTAGWLESVIPDAQVVGPFYTNTAPYTALFYYKFPLGINRAIALSGTPATASTTWENALASADVFAVFPGGGFKLTNGVDTTSSLTESSTAAAVRTALEGFAAFAPGDVAVTKVGNVTGKIGFLIEFDPGINSSLTIVDDGTPDPEMLQMASNSVSAVTEIQSLWTNAIGGTLTLNGVSFAVPTAAATIESAMGGSGVATVTGSGTEADKWIITYTTSGDKSFPSIDVSGLATGKVSAPVEVQVEGSALTPESWLVTIYATGGTFKYGFKDVYTGNLAYNANAATQQTALRALSSFNNEVNVTRTGPFTVTVTGSLVGTPLSQLVATNEDLTGTASPTTTITQIQTARGPNHWGAAENWNNPATGDSGVPVNGDDVVIDIGDDTQFILYDLDQSGVTVNSINFKCPGIGIGLPRINDNGYIEYRDRYLKIGFQGDKKVTIGEGQGDGCKMFKLDAQATSGLVLKILQTGGGIETGVPVVALKCSGSASVELIEGEFGAALEKNATTVISSMVMRNGSFYAGEDLTLGDFEKTGGTIYFDNVAINGNIQIRG